MERQDIHWSFYWFFLLSFSLSFLLFISFPFTLFVIFVLSFSCWSFSDEILFHYFYLSIPLAFESVFIYDEFNFPLRQSFSPFPKHCWLKLNLCHRVKSFAKVCQKEIEKLSGVLHLNRLNFVHRRRKQICDDWHFVWISFFCNWINEPVQYTPKKSN